MGERSTTDAAAEARRRVAAVRDDPAGRAALAEQVYDRLTHAEPADAGFGRAEHAFLRVAIERGVFNPLAALPSGSPWWRATNESLLRDSEEAYLLWSDGAAEGGSTTATQHWLAFFRQPSSAAWYRGHNASIVSGYLASSHLAADETRAEQLLMNLILSRALYAHALAADHEVLGPLKRAGAWLADPRRIGIVTVIDVPDFYPRHYPLTAEDERRIEGRGFMPEEIIARIGIEVVQHHTQALYAWSADVLGIAEVATLAEGGRPCYPRT